jgi:hypothetical protein
VGYSLLQGLQESLGSGVYAALISQLILLMLQNAILAQSSKAAHSCSTKRESVIFSLSISHSSEWM